MATGTYWDGHTECDGESDDKAFAAFTTWEAHTKPVQFVKVLYQVKFSTWLGGIPIWLGTSGECAVSTGKSELEGFKREDAGCHESGCCQRDFSE